MSLLGPATGYVDLLDHATTEKLKKDREEGREYQKSPLRPSAAGSCTRELYYQFMQFSGRAKYETELNEPATHRLLNLGHSVESHILRQFELIADLFEIRYKQQVLSFKHLPATKTPELTQWLEGSLDLVFWSPKFKCVADIKSKKDKFSIGYKTGWDETTEKLERMKSVESISEQAFWVDDLPAFLDELGDPFFSANFLQLNLYANSSFLKERGVNHGAIIQYNKNDSRLREVRFRPSDELYNRVINKFQSVLTAVDEDQEQLATRDFALGSVKCAFCKFRNECWGGVDSKKAFFETFAPKRWPTDTKRLGRHGDALEKLYLKYTELSGSEKELETVERAILLVLADQRVNKVKFANGDIFEVKQLKNEAALRRSKL